MSDKKSRTITISSVELGRVINKITSDLEYSKISKKEFALIILKAIRKNSHQRTNK